MLGYSKPLARVVAVLSTEAGLVDAPASPADEAIAASGGDPEGIRTKVRVDLRPDQRTDKAAVAVLRDLAGMVEANPPGTLTDLDTEFLHDLRGGAAQPHGAARARRAPSLAELLKQQRDALKWVQAFTGPTRDLDVQLLEWDHLLSAVPAERHAALAPVRMLLERRRPAPACSRPSLRDCRTARRGVPTAFLDGDLGPARERPDAKRPIAQVRPAHPQGICLHGRDGCRHRRRHRRRPARAAQARQGACATCSSLFGGLWAVRRGQADGALAQGPAGRAGHPPGPRGAVRPHARPGRRAWATPRSAYSPALAGSGVLVDQPDAEQRAARDRFAADRFADFAAPKQRKLGGQDVRAVKVVATYNIKGGVGKTSAAVNLAALAARDGLRTLLWTLDPQGAAPFLFRPSPSARRRPQAGAGRSAVADVLRGTDVEGLDLLPADFSYRHMDLVLDGRASPPAGYARCWPC